MGMFAKLPKLLISTRYNALSIGLEHISVTTLGYVPFGI